MPDTFHNVEPNANNRVEADHARRGHYQLRLEGDRTSRLEAAFDELLPTIRS